MRLAWERWSPWTRITAIVCVVSVIAYAALAWWWPWRPGRIGGLVFGIFAALLFINAALYPWRRRWRARPLGTARRWLQLHIYGSVIAFLFVVIHMGFRLPAGTMGWLLFVLSAWTTITGLAGVWLQRVVPQAMSQRLSVEAIYERIPELMRALVAEADALMAGAPQTLATLYSGEIRPAIATPRTSMKWLAGTPPDAVTGASIEQLRRFSDGAERQRLDDLESIVRDKADLDAQLSLQGLLRGWLVVHVPPAIALIGLLAVHVIAVVWY
jgi:hypothetical protein